MSASPSRRGAISAGTRALVAAGGALLTVSPFLSWYASAEGGSVSALGLSSLAPEVGLLPALGLFVLLFAVVGLAPSRREVRRARWALALFGLAGLAVAVEIVARLNAPLSADYGTSFWSGVDLGWYIALLGAVLVVAATIAGGESALTEAPVEAAVA